MHLITIMGFPGSSDGKASAYNTGDLGSIPGSGRSPGDRNSNPLQYSCLENSFVTVILYDGVVILNCRDFPGGSDGKASA